jgi:hypothetical protein
MKHLIITGGATYEVTGDDDVDAYLQWLVEARGARHTMTVMSRQQVLTELKSATLPDGFPEPDVVSGDHGKGQVLSRYWLPATVAHWREQQTHQDTAPGPRQNSAQPEGVQPEQEETSAAAAPAAKAAPMQPWWSGVAPRADIQVAIVTSRGVVAPSGAALTRGPLREPADLARFVWHRWPAAPSGKKGQVPQLWITAPALMAVGMKPPTKALSSSDDLSPTVSKLFGCSVTTARAGWFTVAFPPPEGSGEARRVHLVLLPFLWLDAAGQRRNDRGMAGTAETATVLPDDEDAAAQVLGERIAWLAGIADTAEKYRSDPPVLPARRPASIGASLLDTMRRRARSANRLEACPVPDLVHAETPSLEPALEWKNMPHEAKGDAIDVDVDQRAAYLASAGQVWLGYGVPEELTKVDAPALFDTSKAPFGLWRVTTPAAAELDGLDRRLPLPLGHMEWENPATFWTTTRSVQQLLQPVAKGGAGLVPAQLVIDRAWVWPGQATALRTWAYLLRDELATAYDADRQDRVDLIKNIYKAFIGRMAGSDHPPGQRHYQQPVWAATIWADTRCRAMRYARTIADDHGLFPIAARDIDTFSYRLPAGVDPTVLEEQSPDNGRYRIKAVRGPAS